MLTDNREHIDEHEANVVTEGAVVYLSGHIDIDSSPAVRDRLVALLEAPPVKVTIDFSRVTHLDSSGIATLIELLKIARAHNTDLKLQGLHDRLLRLFELTGILSLFNGSIEKMNAVVPKVG